MRIEDQIVKTWYKGVDFSFTKFCESYKTAGYIVHSITPAETINGIVEQAIVIFNKYKSASQPW